MSIIIRERVIELAGIYADEARALGDLEKLEQQVDVCQKRCDGLNAKAALLEKKIEGFQD